MPTQTGNPPVDPATYPRRPMIMWQKWLRLLFLHWSFDPATVQRSLPPELTVETWGGRAWLGVVPFRMRGVRPRFLPPLPVLSNFPEMNVRTYVRDRNGRAGVWFYSLDCPRILAVRAARGGFGLPYHHAVMREHGTDWISFECRRRGADGNAQFRYRAVGPATRAQRGSIEEFLIERYRLFANRRGRALTGEVWHKPYALQAVELEEWSTLPLAQAQFDISGPPEHAVFSPGVNARIFAPEKI